MSFFKELKRRNVFKVGIAYLVTIWILLQLTDVVSEILKLPEWAPKLILLILVVGFIPALIMAWAFEMTPEGIKLEKDVVQEESITPKTGRKLDITIIVLMGLALAYFIWESRFEQKTEDFELAEATAAFDAANPKEPEPVIIFLDEDIDKNTIAVLPFANRSTDAADMFFTDGIHDDLLTQLSRIDAFSVISRTSVMEYRDTTKNLREIANELRVANVMEGAVQRSGDRVRINVQLIDAATDEHLWAEIYDRELTTNNLFDIQSEIAKAIALALKATLTGSELASVGDVPTDNVAAYDLYLQARRFDRGESKQDNQTAQEFYQEALQLDAEFKLAWIGLANTHINNYWLYGGDPADRELARQAIDNAKKIDPDFAELYMAEGFYWYWGYLDYERALYNLEKAISMMPGNDDAHMWHGWASRRAGKWDQARQSMQQALRLNPRVSFNWHEYALTLAYLYQFEEARRAVNEAMSLAPDSSYAKSTLAKIALMENGDTETAVQMTIGAQHTDDWDYVETFMNARIFAGRFEEALEAAGNLPNEMEVHLSLIRLREDWAARVLFSMGQLDEARDAASAALFRLKGLRAQLGDDYRIDTAEAVLRAIRGESAEVVTALINSSRASRPEDNVGESWFLLEHARAFAIVGLTDQAVESIEPTLSPPSESSVHTIDLDPAFNGIRENVGFITMMDRHR